MLARNYKTVGTMIAAFFLGRMMFETSIKNIQVDAIFCAIGVCIYLLKYEQPRGRR